MPVCQRVLFIKNPEKSVLSVICTCKLLDWFMCSHCGKLNMSFQSIHKWSSLVRPLLCDLRFLYGKNSALLMKQLSSCQFSKAGLIGTYSVRTSPYKARIDGLVFQVAKSFTKCQSWGTCQTRVFHTSSRRFIHPVLLLLLKPVAKFSAAMTGRSVRRWFKGLDPAERQKIWAAIRQHWYIPAGICITFAGSTGVYYVSHIEETPITGRKRFVAFTHDQILKIAEAEAAELIENFKDKQYTANDLQAKRVIEVAHRLLKANPELRKMQFKEWQIYVIKDPLVNACVLPSGHMFVFDGILQIADTQDQLAIILGHEMAHAVLEHGVEELSLGSFVDVFVVLCLAAIWCIIPVDGIALITHWFYDKVIKLLTHMPHSRKLEKEADKVGLMFAAKACYDIRQGSILWTKMSYREKLNDKNNNILPEWMLTHPDSLKRARHLDFLQAEAEKWRQEMQCPKLPLQDPREVAKVLTHQIDDRLVASKTGQDLRRVQRQPGLVTVKNH